MASYTENIRLPGLEKEGFVTIFLGRRDQEGRSLLRKLYRDIGQAIEEGSVPKDDIPTYRYVDGYLRGSPRVELLVAQESLQRHAHQPLKLLGAIGYARHQIGAGSIAGVFLDYFIPTRQGDEARLAMLGGIEAMLIDAGAHLGILHELRSETDLGFSVMDTPYAPLQLEGRKQRDYPRLLGLRTPIDEWHAEGIPRAIAMQMLRAHASDTDYYASSEEMRYNLFHMRAQERIALRNPLISE